MQHWQASVDYVSFFYLRVRATLYGAELLTKIDEFHVAFITYGVLHPNQVSHTSFCFQLTNNGMLE